MKMLFVLCFFCFCIGSSSYAQLGISSVGMLSSLGTTTINNCNYSLGKRLLATSATCRCNCNNVLAVTGLHLEGKRQNKNNVALNWYTLTEQNNKGFFVQRSLGNSNAFQTTTFVNSKGNSSSKTNYSLVDVNNFSGITNYRIQQQNNDGSIAYSNVVSIAGIANDKFVIYPNPSSGTVLLLLPSTYSASQTTVTLYDASGRKVYENSYAVGSGAVVQIHNIAHLRTGTYQVIVSSNVDKKLQGKLIIER